jgi:DNA-directed RNA polymerase specialized sigma24 family protein
MAGDRPKRSREPIRILGEDNDKIMHQPCSVCPFMSRNLRGTWLPEPVDTSCDPALGAERGEALKLAVIVLLEKLSPTERAAYVLREAFDYSYRQIAEILQMEEANTRQFGSRARKHVAEGRRTPASSVEQRRLLEAFIRAAQREI